MTYSYFLLLKFLIHPFEKGFYFTFNYMYVMCFICAYVHECGFLRRPEEGVGSPRVGATGGCEQLGVGAEH